MADTTPVLPRLSDYMLRVATSTPVTFWTIPLPVNLEKSQLGWSRASTGQQVRGHTAS